MTLGEKLKQTLEELERARIEGLEKQAKADIEKIRREREDISDWLDHKSSQIVSQIEDSRVPLVKVKNYERQEWLRKAIKGSAEHQDLWNEFIRYWKAEGLAPKLEEAHDGMGMESWINLTVTVLPPRVRGSSSGASGYRVPFENRD